MKSAENLRTDTGAEEMISAIRRIIDKTAMIKTRRNGKATIAIKTLWVRIAKIVSDTPTRRRVDRNQRLNKNVKPSPSDKVDDSMRRQNRGDNNQSSVLRGGYTQILINPMQLTDAEFTIWMEKLVEARRNWQERKPRPYRNFRKPYNSDQSEFRKRQLRNKLQPAQELDVQSIMTMFNCEYDDVVEAVDLYNMDVEESQSA